MNYFCIFVKDLIFALEWVCFWIIYPVLLIVYIVYIDCLLSISLPVPQCLDCCCCLFTQSCPTLCDPMNCSMPTFPVLHNLLEFAHTHVLWVDDAIQPSHPLSLPSLALSLSQHQGLFQWVGSLHQVSKVLEFSFSISSFSEYSGLIFFRIDWFDLFAI